MKENVIALHLSSFVCFKVLVKFLIKSFMVINAPDAVHASLTNLLSVQGHNRKISEMR